MRGTYTIMDEPRPGPWAQIVVDPVWPLFAFMFGGPLWGWAWFLVNGHALGSPTRMREFVFVVVGVSGVFGLSLLLDTLVAAGVVTVTNAPYAMLLFMLWKLGISYWLHELQSRSFELYRYFGGVVRSGVIVVVVAYLFKPTVPTTADMFIRQLLVN